MHPPIDAAGLPAAHGGRSAAVSIRAAVYVDGFNLYHAIDELGSNHLKWLDLFALSQRIVRRGETLERVVWCSAVNNRHNEKKLRWREYRKALEHSGVICAIGHFAEEPRRCERGHRYFHPTEKEGDVNLAIHLISDAHLDLYDAAYLVTADSDQIATARMFRERFPDKQIISIAPPGRKHSKAILAHCHDHRVIRREAIEQSLFSGSTIIDNGELIAKRPAQYAPPQ